MSSSEGTSTVASLDLASESQVQRICFSTGQGGLRIYNTNPLKKTNIPVNQLRLVLYLQGYFYIPGGFLKKNTKFLKHQQYPRIHSPDIFCWVDDDWNPNFSPRWVVKVSLFPWGAAATGSKVRSMRRNDKGNGFATFWSPENVCFVQLGVSKKIHIISGSGIFTYIYDRHLPNGR